MRKITPKLLIGHGRFSTLLETSKFIDYCRKRDVHIDEWKLEFLEKHGQLYPALRIHRPAYKVKIERNKRENTYRELGILEESEQWKGPTLTEFDFPFLSHSPDVRKWTKEKLIYIPDQKTFRPWKEFKSKKEKVEHYYSIFQLLPLHQIVKSFRFPYSSIDLLRMSERRATRYFREHLRYLRSKLEANQDRKSTSVATVCQALSSRYLPFAEQDGPLIQTSTQVNPFDKKKEFNIFDYRRRWNPEKTRKALGISLQEIRKSWEGLIFATEDSPISRWRDLIDLVNREKKKSLKGSVLRSEHFYRMARMLDLFYFDLTGEHLTLGEVVPDAEEIKSWYGVQRADFQYKEFVVNRYGLNPRPSLILMVEGDSEYNEIPKLSEWFLKHPLATYEIQIINLRTIGEFISGKIERFIDHNHSLQTIVYFVLDNENNSLACRDKLISKPSQYEPNLTLTKPQFFTIWERNIEFDNFSDQELADALTEVSENRYRFLEADLAGARSSFGRQTSDPLSELFKAKINYGLNKPKLLSILFETVRQKPAIIVDGKKECRPILNVIRDFSRLAIKNYQPTRLSRWTEAQEEGWIRNRYQNDIMHKKKS